MITPITYPTALDYWRSAAVREDGTVLLDEIIHSASNLHEMIRDAHILRMDTPLHILCLSASSRKHQADFISHVIPGHLPKDSFIKLTDSLFIITPECMFLLAANYLSLQKMVVLANDLCAIYRFDWMSKYFQSSRAPITTVSALSDYLDRAAGVKGVKIARQAVQYALDRSNSPKESELAAIFVLPLSLGGFGLPKPALNKTIHLTPKAAEFLGRETCCCDMVWDDIFVVVEYDSDLAHLTREQHAIDKNRATALSMSGYTVVTITSEHLSSHANIDKLCLDMRNILKLRTHMERFHRYEQVRWNTVEELIFHRSPRA